VRAFERGETILLHARTARKSGNSLVRDDYGMVIYDEEIIPIRGCAIWSNSASESMNDNERTVSTYTVVFPDGFTVDAVDKVVWRGLAYEVSQDVEWHTNPMTGNKCQQFNMTRVEG
jgi:hypothetical protein